MDHYLIKVDSSLLEEVTMFADLKNDSPSIQEGRGAYKLPRSSKKDLKVKFHDNKYNINSPTGIYTSVILDGTALHLDIDIHITPGTTGRKNIITQEIIVKGLQSSFFWGSVNKNRNRNLTLRLLSPYKVNLNTALTYCRSNSKRLKNLIQIFPSLTFKLKILRYNTEYLKELKYLPNSSLTPLKR